MTFCFFILLIVGFFSLPFQSDISFPIRISFGFYINSNANSFYSVSRLASSLQYEKDNKPLSLLARVTIAGWCMAQFWQLVIGGQILLFLQNVLLYLTTPCATLTWFILYSYLEKKVIKYLPIISFQCLFFFWTF